MIPICAGIAGRATGFCIASRGEKQSQARHGGVGAFNKPIAGHPIYLDNFTRLAALEINPRPLAIGRPFTIAFRVVVYLAPEVVRNLCEKWSWLIEIDPARCHSSLY